MSPHKSSLLISSSKELMNFIFVFKKNQELRRYSEITI